MVPKISLIIPVYNVEKYLKQCLDSLIRQTFVDFEIICVDDGSTDGSLDILYEYQKNDSRIIVISKKNKEGAGLARNCGLEQAKGKYIQFLDSDDYFELNMLEELYNYAEKYSADLTVCSYKKINDKGEIIERGNPNSPINLALTPLEYPFSKKDYSNNLFSLLTPIPWNKLILKSLLINNDIKFPRLNICEDIAFAHSCVACAERIVVFNKEFINYRYNRQGSMATYRSKYTIDVVKSCLILKAFLEKKDFYNELEQSFIDAFKNHIRWEIALCNDRDYQIFLTEFKNLMPNDWYKYKSALRKDYITLEYLNKFIGDKKVMLWGASFFLQNLLKTEKTKNPNILGIIDKNEAAWGNMCGNYKIYSPQMLNILKPNYIIMTIWSNYEFMYGNLQKELALNYPNIKLLPNIFCMED